MKIIVMGPQGSGKTSQAELLAKKLNLPHLQTGELYRKVAKEKSPLGKKVKELLDKGHLIPDKEHNELLENEVEKPLYKNGFVLDGSPRTLSQARGQPFGVDKIFYLDVSDEENTKRLLKRGRKDDTPELIAERLRIYHQETEPVLKYFRQQGILEEVDGERPIEAIHQDIMNRLEQ